MLKHINENYNHIYFRLGYIEEAALYIRRSIQINPDYSAARQNLENVCSHLVERWHFRMLNDVRRNCAYKIAIRRAAQRGHRSMIDIGCGTGILRYEKYMWILL